MPGEERLLHPPKRIVRARVCSIHCCKLEILRQFGRHFTAFKVSRGNSIMKRKK